MGIILYEHRDFVGRSQQFEAGTYRADQGQMSGVGNDTISSGRVPFGYTVDMYQHENHGNGSGQKLVLGFGDHAFVGGDFNDKASLVIVYPWTDVYLSTDDAAVPPALNFFSVNFTSTTDGSNQSVGFKIDYDTETKYYKELKYQLPQGSNPNVWEATKNGNAGWEHSVADGLLVVKVWVNPRDIFGARNWIGVRVAL